MNKIKQSKVDNIRILREGGNSLGVIGKKLKCSIATVKKYTKDIVMTTKMKKELHKGNYGYGECSIENLGSKKDILHRSCDIGDLVEASCMAAFMSLGYTVSVPFGCGARYDLIVDDGFKLIKVQCKVGKFIDNRRFTFQCVNVAYGGIS